MSDFKVGDKVSTFKGEGQIVYKDIWGTFLVDLGDGYNGHNGGDGRHPTDTCGWFLNSSLKLIESVEQSKAPEPLENWKHPYYGKPILVRDEDKEWHTDIFLHYYENSLYPVRCSTGSYMYYKFPEPIELTQEELLQIAAEAKGVDVQQIKIKE